MLPPTIRMRLPAGFPRVTAAGAPATNGSNALDFAPHTLHIGGGSASACLSPQSLQRQALTATAEAAGAAATGTPGGGVSAEAVGSASGSNLDLSAAQIGQK